VGDRLHHFIRAATSTLAVVCGACQLPFERAD
jgi:hypothetical protein